MDTSFIEGKGICLREVRESDLDGNWYSWLNDSEVTTHQNKGIFPNTPEKQRAYYKAITESDTDVVLAIVDKHSGSHIGCVGLHNIDKVHRSAELGIVIGEKQFWGRGYGKEAWYLMTRYGFKVLNLHRIYATVISKNVPSAKSALAAGFQQEGELRDVFFKNGQYHSAVYLNILESDFDQPDE